MLTLTEDQQLLADSAAQVTDSEAPISRFRKMRDDGLTTDAALWDQLVELGWPSLVGLELADLAVVLEALGRNLVVSPMISTVMAAAIDEGAGADEGRILAVAWREGRSADPSHCKATVRDGRLTGKKVAVLDGSAAEGFFVTATPAGQATPEVFFVDASQAEVTRLTRLDYRDAADVGFDGATTVRVADFGVLQHALDRGTVALCAEMLGGMQAALDLTLAYLKERHQFGVPIGSFQALQHRAVDCFIDVELSRSTVMAAAREPTPALVSLCKAQCSDAYLRVVQEAIQLLGGIGMTDEHDIGFYLKRALVAAHTLGDAAHHRDRWGCLRGY